MADSSVLLEVVVEGKNIKVVQRQVEELADAVNRTSVSNNQNTKSTEENTKAKNKNSRSTRDLYRNQQGLAQNTSSGTKAFSKQARGLTGGLVPAYAALAANIFALTALFGALQRAAAVEQLEQGLIAVGAASGQNLPRVADRLKEITGFAVSTKEALEATAIATSAGFSTAQLERLTGVARGAATALGRDLPDALNRLVRGTAKLEPEILDELGIMVRLDDAATEYAKSLGKTATELTRFERQQAFLNETITQGEQKFGDITKNIDPNPYNQLSAAFQDLSKVLFKVVNTVVTPFVEFLNQNSFALTGALVLFGSTVLSQVATPLREAAEEAANLSTIAAQKAKQAASTVKSAFDQQLKVVNSSIKTIPKSMEAIIPAFKNGTVSVKEMRSAVTILSNSERQRNARLKNYSGEQLAQKKAEIAEVVALRMEIEKLINTERQRGTTSFKGIDVGNLSNSQKALSRYLGLLADAGPIEGFKIAVRGAGRQLRIFNATMARGSKNLGFFGKSLLFVRGGFRAVTASVRLFGAALLNAIPIIGQIIFFGSMLYEALSWMWEDTALQKASKDIVKSFENIEKTAARLSNVKSTPDITEAEVYNAELNVSVGLINQLIDGVNKLKTAQEDESKSAIEAAKKQYLRDKQRVQNLEEGLTGVTEFDRLVKLDQAYSLLAKSTKKLAEARKEAKEGIDKEEFNNITNSFLEQIESSEDLKVALAEVTPQIEKLQAQVRSGTFTGGYSKAIEQLEEIKKPYDKILSSQKAVTEEFGNLTKESIKFSKASKTEFDPIITAITSIGVEIAQLEKGRINLVDKASQKRAEVYVDTFRELFGINENTQGEALKVASKELAKQVTLIKTSKETSSEQAALAKKYGEIAKTNATFAEMQIKAERASIDAKIAGKQAELNLTKVAIAEDVRAQREILNDVTATEAQKQEAADKLFSIQTKQRALQTEITSLEISRIDSARETLMLTEAKTAQEQVSLNLNNKILAAQDRQRDVSAKILQDTLQLSRARTGSDSTAEDEYNLTLAANTAKLDAEDTRLQLQLKGIELEYKLLEAKQAFEKARLQGLRDEAGASSEQIASANQALQLNEEITSLIRNAREETVKAAREQSKLTKQQLQSEISIKKELKDRAQVTLQLEKSRALIAAASSALDSGALSILEITALETERRQIQEDLVRLYTEQNQGAQNSQAILKKETELQQKVTEQLSTQIKLQEYYNNTRKEFQESSLDTIRQIAENEREIATLRNTNPFTGEALNTAKQAKIEEQARRDRLDIAQMEFALKSQMIDAEYDLLEARFGLLKAELAKDGLTMEEKQVIAATEKVLQQAQISNEFKKRLLEQELILTEKQVAAEREKASIAAIEKGASSSFGGGLRAAIEEIQARKAPDSDGEKSETQKMLDEMFKNRKVSNEQLTQAAIVAQTQAPEKIAEAITKTGVETAKETANAVAEAIGQVIANMTVANMIVQNMATTAGVPTATTSSAVETAVTESSDKINENFNPDKKPAFVSQSASLGIEKPNIVDMTAGLDSATMAADIQNQMSMTTPEVPKPDNKSFMEAMAETRLITQGFIADMAKLGPEGEAIAAFTQGSLNLIDGLDQLTTAFNDASVNGAQKAQAVLQSLGSVIGAIGQMQAASSAQKIAAIDKEIAAEKKRDGKSKESIAKLKSLEAKKEQMERKQFERNKKMKMAEIVINTAAAIMGIWSGVRDPFFSPVVAGIQTALVASLGAAQLAMVAGTSYQGSGGGISTAGGPSAISVGDRKSTVDLAKSKSASGELAYMRGEQGTGGPENFTPAFMGAKYRAAGGPTAGYVVGEQGPELFVPSTPGTIVPESKVAPTNPTNVNFTITALDASGVEDILVRQRGNIIGMMREAANSYGQPFLEGVDVASYTQEAGGVTRY